MLSTAGLLLSLITPFVVAIPSQVLLAQELECRVSEWLPIGLARQGGYAFNYQSGRGPNCRVYRLRNMPGGLLTPVRWRDRGEIFIDQNLAACTKETRTCPWMEAIKISSRAVTGRTTISYGVNKDEYSDYPDAYRRGELAAFAPLVTILRGITASAAGEPVEIEIRVVSTVQAGAVLRLQYEIMLIRSSVGAFEYVAPGKRPEGFGIVWESPTSSWFLDYIGSVRRLAIGSPRSVATSTTAPLLVDSSRLVVMQRDREILATTAPAYKPRE